MFDPNQDDTDEQHADAIMQLLYGKDAPMLAQAATDKPEQFDSDSSQDHGAVMHNASSYSHPFILNHAQPQDANAPASMVAPKQDPVPAAAPTRDQIMRDYLETGKLPPKVPLQSLPPGAAESFKAPNDTPISPNAGDYEPYNESEQKAFPGEAKAPAAMLDDDEDKSKPSDPDQAMKDYLNGYKTASDDSGVVKAKADQKRGNFVANMGEALEWLARSNSMAHGGPAVDPHIYDAMRTQGMAGVKLAQQERDHKMQEFMNNFKIQNAVANEKRTAQTFKWQQEIHDGNSAQSKNAAQFMRHLWPAYAPAFPDGMSADQAYKMGELVKTKAIDEENRMIRKSQLGISFQANDRAKEANDRAKEAADRDAEKFSYQKTKDSEAKYETLNKLARNPEDKIAAQAKVGLGAAEKAREVLSLKTDPNDMSHDEVSKLQEKMAAVSTMGNMTNDVRHSNAYSSYTSNWQKFLSEFHGQPTGAQLGEFIKQNIKYLEVMEDTNRKNYSNYLNGLVHQYGTSEILLPKHLESFKQNPEFSKYLNYKSPAPDSQSGVEVNKTDRTKGRRKVNGQYIYGTITDGVFTPDGGQK